MNEMISRVRAAAGHAWQHPWARRLSVWAAVLENMVATACLQGQRLWLVDVTGNGTLLGRPRAVLTGEFGRLRALVAAPDGSFWVTTSNQEEGGDPRPDDDQIIRLVFSDGGAGRS